jgi:hypothetical protein
MGYRSSPNKGAIEVAGLVQRRSIGGVGSAR